MLGARAGLGAVTFGSRSMSVKIVNPAMNTSTGMPAILHTTLQALMNRPSIQPIHSFNALDDTAPRHHPPAPIIEVVIIGESRYVAVPLLDSPAFPQSRGKTCRR